MSARAHRGPDVAHRRRRLDLILEYFISHPGEWIDVHTLAHVGGFAAWRSRVAEARVQLRDKGQGSIEWNGEQIESAYRFVPWIPLAGDPGTYRAAKLF
jgi:hypothetical protein